jgi:hypothetical protein
VRQPKTANFVAARGLYRLAQAVFEHRSNRSSVGVRAGQSRPRRVLNRVGD